MTLDASAIKELQEQLPKLEAVQEFCGRLGSEPAVLIPDGFKFESVEGYMPAPVHFKGTFKTEHQSSFVKYVDDHKQADTACFISAEKFQADAIFTLGTIDAPKHRHHKALLRLTATEAYTAMANACGNSRGEAQQEFAFWLQDWADNIQCSDADNVPIPEFKSVIKAVRQVKIDEERKTESSVQHFNVEQSTLEKMGVSSEHTLPAYVKFSCVPYKGLKLREFILRVQIHRSPGVRFTLKPIAWEQHQEEMREEFQLLLEGDLQHTGVKLLIGDFTG